MKFDAGFVRQILEAFEASPTSTSTVDDVAARLGESLESDRFVFHMELLADDGLVRSTERRTVGIGTNRNMDHEVTWVVQPLRLTADGVRALELLRSKTVQRKLGSYLSTAGLSVITELGKDWLKREATKLLGP